MMADRYLYLAELGLFFIAACYLLRLVEQLPARGWKQLAVPLLLCIYLCALGAYTWLYIDLWNVR